MTDTTAVRKAISQAPLLQSIGGFQTVGDVLNADIIQAIAIHLAAQPSAGAQDEREVYLRGSLDVVLRAVLDMARVGIEVAKQDAGYHTEERDRARIDFIREVCERWKATPAQTDTGDVAALRAFGEHPSWELSFGGEDDHAGWQVHSVNGGRNDREWTLLSGGHETPLDAILAALSKPNAQGREG